MSKTFLTRWWDKLRGPQRAGKPCKTRYYNWLLTKRTVDGRIESCGLVGHAEAGLTSAQVRDYAQVREWVGDGQLLEATNQDEH